MNKESIDYTSAEFWATAPSDAAHFYPEDHEFHASFWEFSKGMQALQCWVIYPDKTIEHCKNPSFSQRMGTGIPRPNTFTKPVQEDSVTNTDWFVDGKCVTLPPVGIDVEADFQLFGWRVATVVGYDGLITIVRDEDSYIGVRKSELRPIKKELTIQEKILDKWKAQGIDFAYDNEDTTFSFKVLIDFVVNNFDVKEKE